MQLLAAALMGSNIDAAGFADQVGKRLAPGGDLARLLAKLNADARREAKENRKSENEAEQIKPRYLLSKLEHMSSETMVVLLVQLHRWWQLPGNEMTAHNGLPSICTLQRLGLVEPDDDIAWGWFCFRDQSAWYEFVLHNPQRMPLSESRTTDELTAELVRSVETSPSPLHDETIWDLVYRIVKVTGWRRCLVVSDGGKVRVTEVPIHLILNDFYTRTLRKVTLAGVNAPDTITR